MAEIRPGDGEYAAISAAHAASKGELFEYDDLMWRVYEDGAGRFFISLSRDEADTYSKDGKWSKYYGPNSVPDEW